MLQPPLGAPQLGDVFDQSVHFQCELALPNCSWLEKTLSISASDDLQGASDLPYIKDSFRIQPDGYIHASTKPGLGCEIDHDVLDKMLLHIER